MDKNIVFRTVNSLYEVDPLNKNIRRLTGNNSPTKLQGADGEWKSYFDITPTIKEGSRVLIQWDQEGRTTITSPVIRMED